MVHVGLPRFDLRRSNMWEPTGTLSKFKVTHYRSVVSAVGSERPFAATAPQRGWSMSALRTKLPFAASAPKDGLPMSALRTKLPFAAGAPKDGLPMSALRTKQPFAAGAPKDTLPMSALRTNLPFNSSATLSARCQLRACKGRRYLFGQEICSIRSPCYAPAAIWRGKDDNKKS
jgi:hypothetical protein